MVVNFRTRKISRDTHKLAERPILIKKIDISPNFVDLDVKFHSFVVFF